MLMTSAHTRSAPQRSLLFLTSFPDDFVTLRGKPKLLRDARRIGLLGVLEALYCSLRGRLWTGTARCISGRGR